jgi:hypothetical protein
MLCWFAAFLNAVQEIVVKFSSVSDKLGVDEKHATQQLTLIEHGFVF